MLRVPAASALPRYSSITDTDSSPCRAPRSVNSCVTTADVWSTFTNNARSRVTAGYTGNGLNAGVVIPSNATVISPPNTALAHGGASARQLPHRPAMAPAASRAIHLCDEALAANDLDGAAEVFAAVLEADQGNVRALLGLTKVYLASADLVRAEATLELVPPDKRKQAAYDSLKASLDLAKKAGTADNRVELETRLIANPADHEARFDLAVALAARGDKAEAVDHLIEIVRRDRNWNEQAARQQLVQLFEAWGPKDPATLDGRRRLSSLLFR